MDGERLARLRAGLRERMRASRLTDARGFARDVEEAFIEMRERAAGAQDPT